MGYTSQPLAAQVSHCFKRYATYRIRQSLKSKSRSWDPAFPDILASPGSDPRQRGRVGGLRGLTCFMPAVHQMELIRRRRFFQQCCHKLHWTRL